MLDNKPLERLTVVETKVSKIDAIEEKVSDIQISVAKIENKLENLIDNVERHLHVDSKRLDQVENYVLEQKAHKNYRAVLVKLLSMLLGIVGTITAIYMNLKGN